MIKSDREIPVSMHLRMHIANCMKSQQPGQMPQLAMLTDEPFHLYV